MKAKKTWPGCGTGPEDKKGDVVNSNSYSEYDTPFLEEQEVSRLVRLTHKDGHFDPELSLQIDAAAQQLEKVAP